MDDNTIVEQYLSKDEAAIKNTSEKYGRRLNALAMRIICDSSSADECENDTYMQAWNSIPPHEPRDYLYAFLARITRHLALDMCEKNHAKKRQAHIVEITDELGECIAGTDNIEDAADEMVLRESLNRFLASLDEDKRCVFLRRYWFMDEIEDISKRFGYSQSKVKSMLMRMRDKLREHLKAEDII